MTENYAGSPLAEASDFKFGKQVGFAKAHKKSHQKTNADMALGQGAPQCLGFPLIFLQWLKLQCLVLTNDIT